MGDARQLSEGLPRCAVIIPTYNGGALTTTCLTSLLASPPERCQWQIVVVDDGSSDNTPRSLARFGSQIEIVRLPTNTGFARACNAGAKAADACDYLVFLNNDTLPVAGWLDALVDEIKTDDRIGAVGAKLLFPGGLVQHAGVTIGQDGWPHHLYAGFDGEHPAVNRPKAVAAVTAACMLVRRGEFEELGGFDTAFHNGYEDIDLCLRLGRRGKVIRYCPTSVLYHLESVTRWPTGSPVGTEISDRVYSERWRSHVKRDDVQHYLEDGLIELSYGAHYPVTMKVSPELAAIQRDGRGLAGMDKLLAERSRQVMQLIGAETRRELRAAARSAPPPTPVAAAPSRLTHAGREHRLGDGPARHLISVVIPVKDSAGYLRDLLPAILGQSVSARVEIVAVDSGSSDDTIPLLQRFGATVLEIASGDFDHGLTRNIAAETARGDILVFVSHRSQPVGDRWLAPLVAALDDDPELAGVCSRVSPRPEADVLTRRDVERDLSASQSRRRIQITDWSAYREMPPEERRAFLNFHTVSAAIRAEAWKTRPFRAMRALGEDLLWARETLESGWALLHEPASVVRHSHTYSLGQLLERNVDDGIANRDIVERILGREEVIPLIRSLVHDDWAFLTNTAGLEGDELERWQLESALRRGAQILGQWVGINYETLPEAMVSELSSIARLRRASDDSRSGASDKRRS